MYTIIIIYRSSLLFLKFSLISSEHRARLLDTVRNIFFKKTHIIISVFPPSYSHDMLGTYTRTLPLSFTFKVVNSVLLFFFFFFFCRASCFYVLVRACSLRIIVVYAGHSIRCYLAMIIFIYYFSFFCSAPLPLNRHDIYGISLKAATLRRVFKCTYAEPTLCGDKKNQISE